MDVIENAMRRSRTVVLTLLVVLIGGLVAYATIPKEAEPDIVPDCAGDLCAPDDGNDISAGSHGSDPPGVEHVERHLEDVAGLEEEGTPVLEEELEMRQVHLGSVRFDLPEVGVQREIRSDTAGQAHLGIQTCLPGVVPGVVVLGVVEPS